MSGNIYLSWRLLEFYLLGEAWISLSLHVYFAQISTFLFGPGGQGTKDHMEAGLGRAGHQPGARDGCLDTPPPSSGRGSD